MGWNLRSLFYFDGKSYKSRKWALNLYELLIKLWGQKKHFNYFPKRMSTKKTSTRPDFSFWNEN